MEKKSKYLLKRSDLTYIFGWTLHIVDFISQVCIRTFFASILQETISL